MQFKFLNYRFTLNWLGLLLTIICVPLFIKLGNWQYQKAVLKQEIQKQYQDSLKAKSISLAENLKNVTELKYKKVNVVGAYEPQYQILIDNQVEDSQAGYHVITPFKLDGTSEYVLVNRGWIPGKDTRTEIPTVDTPQEKITLEGMVWIPASKIFTLEDQSSLDKKNETWQNVWQHLDMARYQRLAPIKILPVIIKLDPQSNAGGFVRRWEAPIQRIATHMGYAYQWYGFALATVLIFIIVSIKRIKH